MVKIVVTVGCFNNTSALHHRYVLVIAEWLYLKDSTNKAGTEFVCQYESVFCFLVGVYFLDLIHFSPSNSAFPLNVRPQEPTTRIV